MDFNKKFKLSLFILLTLLFLSAVKIISAKKVIGISGFSNVISPSITPVAEVTSEEGETPLESYGVNLYWDEACTDPIVHIDWGSVSPGGSVNRIIYIRNEETGPGPIYMVLSDWNPVDAAYYIHTTWNYDEQILYPNNVIQVTLTLSADPDTTGITSFSNIITIGMIGYPGAPEPACYVPLSGCDGKHPYESWCDGDFWKSCDSDCTFFQADCYPLSCSGDVDWSNWVTKSVNVAIFYSPSCPTGSYPIACLSESARSEDELNYGEDGILNMRIDNTNNRCIVVADDTYGGYEHKRRVGVVCSDVVETSEYWNPSWQTSDNAIATFYSDYGDRGQSLSYKGT